MIRTEKTDNIFDSDCDIIVIPVNCEGIMGAGLAKQLKELYLNVYYLYKHLCKVGDIRIDQPVVVRDKQTQRPFLLLPTKEVCSDKSTYYIIQKNLNWIRNQALKNTEHVNVLHGIESIAIPPIGCGCGELDFKEVKDLIYQYLGDIPLQVDIYNHFFVPHRTHAKQFFRRK